MECDLLKHRFVDSDPGARTFGAAGAETVWTVTEKLRKVYLTG